MLRFWLLAILPALACALSACNSAGPRNPLFGNTLNQVQVTAANDVNLIEVILLDIVFVYDFDLSRALPRASPEWFTSKTSIVPTYARELEVVSIEFVPGGVLQDVTLPSRHRGASKVLVYANYLTPEGQSVADISLHRCVTIALAARTFALVPCANLR